MTTGNSYNGGVKTNLLKGKIMKTRRFLVFVIMLPASLSFILLIGRAGSKESRESDAINAILDLARDDNAFVALMKAKTIKCFLGKGCTADWTTGDPNLTIGKWREKPEECIMILDSIDLKKGTARFVGALGSTDVNVITTPKGLTFVEATDSGNLMVTTVFASYKKGTKKHIFVHSRHWSFLEPLCSQYHGVCETLE